MVVLPAEYVMTRWPGYFWNTVQQRLYSIKSGVLKPMKSHQGWNRGGYNIPPGYVVSVFGERRQASLHYLQGLKQTEKLEIIQVK